MAIRTVLMTLLTAFGISLSAHAADHSAPAIQGYDPVSYHTDKRPQRGSGHFSATHDGATYLFANSDNLKTFKRNPDKYVPAYNGYCAFGVAVGKKFVADPEVYRVVDGKVYLNLDANIQDDWLKDVSGYIRKGDKNWTEIAERDAASL